MASSAAASSDFVSHEEFNLFHRIDRELYTLMVIHLMRDPMECMQILALWLWVERIGFGNVVKKISSLPYILVNELADEAISCLNCINNNNNNCQIILSEINNEIPLLQCLMEKEISLQFFWENRFVATQGIEKIMNQVCIRAFADIMNQAIWRENQKGQKTAEENYIFPPNYVTQMLARSAGPSTATQYSPKSHHPLLISKSEGPVDDRTMFVTFSKGYPVHEWEVKEFFKRAYGECIESLHMQEVEPEEQSLFARIVFHKSSTIDMILEGTGKAKFTINGKHVWARKFVPKRVKNNSLMPPQMVPSLSETERSDHTPLRIL